MLGERFSWWEQNRCAINSCPLVCHLPELQDCPDYYSQKKSLTKLKEDLIIVKWSGELIDLSFVYSQVLQDVVKRVDLAFQRFIKGDCQGQRSGKPRFKSESTFKSFCYPQIKPEWISSKGIKLPKIGQIKVKYHRPIPNGFVAKTCIISKKSDGWYATISLEDKSVPAFKTEGIEATFDNSIGLDAVLDKDTFLATSEGQLISARKAFRKNENKLAKVSQRKAATKKGSTARRKLAKKQGKLHQKIARSRKNHHFKVATELSKQDFKVYFVEDLNLKNLTKRNKAKQVENGHYLPNNQSSKSGLNKSFLDAGFGQFIDILSYKVEKTGSKVVKVKPNYTSQICSNCDAYVPKSLSERIHHCPECQITLDRDINASINIKKVGVGLFPTIKRCRGKLVVVPQRNSALLKPTS
jgi:putative transposase